MYKTRITTEIIVANKTILPDGYSSIFIQNNSDKDVRVLDNIILTPGEFFKCTNDPGVIIDTNISVVFDVDASGPTAQKLLVIKTYYKKEYV